MIRVHLLFFGIVTDLIGQSSLEMELDSNSSVDDFKKELQSRFQRLTEINSYAIAVNENYATGETILKENDVIAIIPPVSGG